MSVPYARSTELDGALGIAPPTTGLMAVKCGACASGTSNQPAAFQSTKNVQTNFGTRGPTVESAAYELDTYGRAIVMLKTAASVAAAFGAIDNTGFTGTAVPAIDAGTAADDYYNVLVVFTVGGVLGTAGIKYKCSLDGGRTFGPVTALGTAVSITIPDSGGIAVDIGAALDTVVAGDEIAFSATPSEWNTADLTAAMNALKSSALAWDFVEIVGPMTAAAAAIVDAAIDDMHSKGKHHWWIGHFRRQNVGETDAAYQTAFQTEFSNYATTNGVIIAGDCYLTSTINGRQLIRPGSFPVSALAGSVSEEIDLADVDLGALPAVQIRDSNGNPDRHDEFESPGLDDLRACTLRTWPSYQGVYVNNPRILSASGSDFVFLQFRRVMNTARTILDAYMTKRLSKHIRASKKTGFILEAEAVSIETAANQLLRQALLRAPKASDVIFTLSRDDAILNPPYPLTGKLRIEPLAYPKAIEVECSWNNPGLHAGV